MTLSKHTHVVALCVSFNNWEKKTHLKHTVSSVQTTLEVQWRDFSPLPFQATGVTHLPDTWCQWVNARTSWPSYLILPIP